MGKKKMMPPPVFRGSSEEKLEQCYRYLLQLHRQLVMALEERDR
jgi:hypothetical protein